MNGPPPPPRSGLAWHLRKILDLSARISRAYYARKHRAWAKEVGRPRETLRDTTRGFIVIQIDALSHSHLLKAVDEGYVPFLASLLNSGAVRLARWRCGQPTTTPAVQAGIMYGENFDIPAFRWYEKERRASVVTKSPGFMGNLQQRLAKGRVGILFGGSSYVNMLDGDAALSLLTLGAFGGHRFFENMRGLGFLILLALSPWSVLRIVARAIWEYLEDVWEWLPGLFHPSRRRQYAKPSPLYRIANDVVFREIQTFAAMLDIYRGVPSIYTNFNSYDDVAHHYGADSPKAFRTLRGIDKQIRRIDRMRRLYTRREYDLYVLSDHGMTPSLPFEQGYGQTLGEWIRDHTLEPVLLDEMPSGEDLAAVRMQLLLEELRGVEEQLGPRRRAFVRRLRRLLSRRLSSTVDTSDWDLQRRGDIVVRNSGSVAHVYFNIAPRRLNLSEMALAYPELLQSLAEHPGIGMIVAREGEHTIAIGARGRVVISDEGVEVDGEDPLQLADEPGVAAEQIHYLASFPHSGDIIVFGGWHEPGVITSFEDQISTHGGLGGDQDYPFILYPARYHIPTESIRNSRQLYPFFVNLYLAQRIPTEVYVEATGPL